MRGRIQTLAAGIDLGDREVGERVAPNDLDAALTAIAEERPSAVRAFDHVGRGEHVAVGREDDRGTRSGRPPASGALAAHA